MRRPLLLLLLMASLVAQAMNADPGHHSRQDTTYAQEWRRGLWEKLSDADHHITDDEVKTLRLDLNTLTFFHDNEYSSRLSKGYSLPGLTLLPKLTYAPISAIRMELGLHALIFNGANKYPNYVYHDIGRWKGNQYQHGAHMLPWFRAQAQVKDFTFVMGDIYGGQDHGLIKPLWNTETNLSQDPEAGFQILWERPYLDADLWLNWQSYIFEEDSHQEAFTVGTTWRVRLNQEKRRSHWYLPIQMVLQHRGGEQDTTALGVQTLCNFSAGLGYRHLLPYRRLSHLSAEASILGAWQQSGHLWPFRSGLAVHAAAGARFRPGVDLHLGYFGAPRHFVSLYGAPFFTTLSQRTEGHSHQGIHTLYAHLRADYTHPRFRRFVLGAEAQAWQSFLGDCPAGKSHEFNFSFGLYLRINPTFTLKRWK